MPLDEQPSTVARTSRRALLVAGTAAVATACSPFSSDENAEGPAVTVPDTLPLADVGQQPLVDDGDGTTTPNNEGTLADPDSDADGDDNDPGDNDAGNSTRATSRATTTTVAATALATVPGTTGSTTTIGSTTTAAAAPSTTVASTTAAPTTATPTTAAPTTATPSTTGPVATPTTAAPPTAPSTTSPPSSAPTTTEPVVPPPAASARLVTSRLTFGITPEVDADIIALDIRGWVEDQLSKSTADPAVERLLTNNGYIILDGSPKEIRTSLENETSSIDAIGHAQILRARYSDHQLYEMMTHLWMDHFNVSADSTRGWALVADYQEQVIRPNAMGRFADLLVATAESGAMMDYLDNARSDARSGINENYGRELLELHTLGIDENDAQIYDEFDVAAAAHVMSGWSLVANNDLDTWGQFTYDDAKHSTEAVSLLGGEWTNAGLSGKAAGDSLLQFLARHPQTAEYIAFKLCRRFVADSPPASLVASAAAVYLANDTDLVPVLRHIFSSSEFADSGGQKARRPFELLSATMRSLGTSVPIAADSDGADQLRFALRRMGHSPWMWPTPDGYPDEAGRWVNSTALLNGWHYTSRLARDRLTSPDDASPLVTDISALRGNASNGLELFERIAFRCNLGTLPDDLRTTLLGVVGVTATTPAAEVDDNTLIELTTYLLAHPLFLLR